MKNFLRKVVPTRVVLSYHFLKAWVAAAYYSFPSRSMIVIGVTGTKGKTSVSYFIWSALNAAGLRTGIISTAVMGIDSPLELNRSHMSMPGGFFLHGLLNKYRRNKCEAVVIETTSQGISQYRHKAIDYDIVVFTNLTPEHIEAHGSFEAYRAEKQRLFADLSKSKRKIISGEEIRKIIIASADSPESKNFLKFDADKKITYGVSQDADIRAENVKEENDGVYFVYNKEKIHLSILGSFNAINVLPAIAIGGILKLDLKLVIGGIQKVLLIPGRMEVVESMPFMVVVDYAHEPESIRQALSSARALAKDGNIFAVFGSAGGGRDKQKRPVMGKIAYDLADIVILTADDSYEENPSEVIRDIASGITKRKEVLNRSLFEITDRQEAIRKAITLAKKGDVVMILGMGAEQSMAIGGKKISWDDRMVAREEFKRIVHNYE